MDGSHDRNQRKKDQGSKWMGSCVRIMIFHRIRPYLVPPSNRTCARARVRLTLPFSQLIPFARVIVCVLCARIESNACMNSHRIDNFAANIGMLFHDSLHELNELTWHKNIYAQRTQFRQTSFGTAAGGDGGSGHTNQLKMCCVAFGPFIRPFHVRIVPVALTFNWQRQIKITFPRKVLQLRWKKYLSSLRYSIGQLSTWNETKNNCHTVNGFCALNFSIDVIFDWN